MFRMFKLASLAAVIATTAAFSPVANAKTPHGMGFKEIDATTGDVKFDDGVDDNKICATKKVSVWDIAKQDFVEKSIKVKCNYKTP